MMRFPQAAPLHGALLTVALGIGALVAPGTALAQLEGELNLPSTADPGTTEVTTAIDIQPFSPSAASQAAISADSVPAVFLEELRQREQGLEIRERALDNEREALESLLSEIEARIAELQTIRDEMSTQLTGIDRERSNRIESLATWYAGMAPEQAAEQLATQQVQTIVDILMEMEESAAAAVLENFAVEDAARVIAEMSRRR